MPKDFFTGKGVDKTPALVEIKNLDTICDNCFAQVGEVYYNVTKKTLLVICINGHELNREGNWSQILGLDT